jgi:hypothetical protein
LEFLDGLEEAVDFIAGFADFFLKLSVDFVAALNLRLEIANCPIDIAD